jgi:hydroxymethylglutaryl-CoA reductase (NADPH)
MQASMMAEGVPYQKDILRDHSLDAASVRQRFVEECACVTLHHVTHFSIDPISTLGNIESFTGVAQVPLAFAGPMKVNGEHAKGDFLIPLATTEGSLVASYNRGIKLLNAAGGVPCTVSADRMQRAPVFIFDSARDARDFAVWVQEKIADIRAIAEATSRVAKLQRIESYLASRFAFLRLDYTTGDAGGQNMVGRATLAACEWIVANNPSVRSFFLDSQLSSDKKVSYINMLRTRGKRVTAEATIPRAVLVEQMHVEPRTLAFWAGVAGVGSHLAGAMNNGLHAVNALAAMFIATGQDVANVAEGSAATGYLEVTAAGDLYVAITLPSLIVATHGGGTHLGTQRECLEVMGCYGTGKVRKLAEIIAGVALAGELSLAAAICTKEWVTAHEKFGRNR